MVRRSICQMIQAFKRQGLLKAEIARKQNLDPGTVAQYFDMREGRCTGISHLMHPSRAYLAFWGVVDMQKALPFGTARDIGREVGENLRKIVSGVGYIWSPANNVVTMFHAAQEYGIYRIG